MLKVIRYYKNGFRIGLLTKEGRKYNHILETPDFKIRKHKKEKYKICSYCPKKYLKTLKNSKYSQWRFKKDQSSKLVKSLLK